MNERQYQRICNDLIMTMNSIRPMSEKERKEDRNWGIMMMVLLIFAPLIAGVVLSVNGRTWVGLIIMAVCWLLFLVLGLGRRKKFIRAFYQDEDGVLYIDLHEEKELPEELRHVEPVLLFAMPPEKPFLNLIYNWLLNRCLIRDRETLQVHHMHGRDIAGHISIPADADTDVLLVPLAGSEPDDWQRMLNEAAILKVHVFSSILKKENGEE